MPALCRLLRAEDLSHIVIQKPFCYSVFSFKFSNSVNQITIFLLALPHKIKYSKVNQMQAQGIPPWYLWCHLCNRLITQFGSSPR